MEASNYNLASFAKDDEVIPSLKLMFHDLSANIIEDVLVVAISWEDVLPNNHSESGSESGSDVIQLFVDM